MEKQPHLKRELGVIGAASLGVAQIIGAGIFIFSGIALGAAGPSVIISFLIAGFTAMLAALSIAELSSFITEMGASYAYTKRAFGRFWGFLVGWFKYFDYMVGAAAIAIGFAHYFAGLFGTKDPFYFICVTLSLPILFTILNVLGIKEAAGATTLMVLIKIFVLVLLLMVGGFYLFNHFDATKYHPFFPTGVDGTLQGATLIFFAFLGFNSIAMTSEETKDPGKTVPKAILIAFFVTAFLYVAIGALEVSTLDWRLEKNSSDPLAQIALTISNNRMLFDIISLAALVAMGSVLLTSITGGTRASCAMARDGLLPAFFHKISARFSTPYVAIFIGGTIISLLAAIFRDNISFLASVINFGCLFTFLFIHLSLMRLRKLDPNAKRAYKTPLYPLLPLLGIASCLGMMWYLSTPAKIASAIWCVIGILIYVFCLRKKILSE